MDNHEITEIRIRHARRTFVAFVDGEFAFCRPPPAVPLAQLWDIGVCRCEWLGIDSMLGHLYGYLKTRSDQSKFWHIECGVPQGDALPSNLFALTLRELPQRLLIAGCGVNVSDGTGPCFECHVWHMLTILYCSVNQQKVSIVLSTWFTLGPVECDWA